MLKDRYPQMAKSLVILLALVFCLVSLVSGRNSSVNHVLRADDNDKKTITEAEWRNPPIRFTKLKLGDREIKLKEEFEKSGDDWFKDFTLTIKNVSNKDIKYLDLYLSFPETQPYGFVATGYNFRYGRYRGIWEHGNDFTLKAGDEIEIRISEEFHNIIKKNLEEQRKQLGSEQCAIRNLKNLELLIEMVMFSDDTMFYGDYLVRESPESNRFVHPDITTRRQP